MPGNTDENHFSKVCPYCHHIAHNTSNESKWGPFMGILKLRHVENSYLDKLHKYSGYTKCSISLWPKVALQKILCGKAHCHDGKSICPFKDLVSWTFSRWYFKLCMTTACLVFKQLLNYPHAAYHNVNYYHTFWDKFHTKATPRRSILLLRIFALN